MAMLPPVDHRQEEATVRTLLTGFVSLLLLGAGAAWADDNGRGAVHRFVTLPDGVRLPEGITANPESGDIYVATFDGGNTNRLLRYSKNGQLEASRNFGTEPLLGLEFDRAHQKVYITNVGD